MGSKRRTELCDRIVYNTARVREYGDGSERATKQAVSYCKQVIDDANELLDSLERRVEAIKGSDAVLHVGRQ